MQAIILIGFMGAGKSTISKRLSQELQLENSDLDVLIEKHIQMPISTFFEKYGEDKFRKIEAEIFTSIIDEPTVIATGGGIVQNQANLDLLAQSNKVIYLKNNFKQLMERVKKDSKNARPLIQTNDLMTIEHLYNLRKPAYERVASLVIETTNQTPEKIVNMIITSLKEREK